MPFYEYRPKSGACSICDGRFVDLQSMSDAPHTRCPDCKQECERVISAPTVSVKGSEFRAGENRERRLDSIARARGELAKKRAPIAGHTHDCALHGCYGDESSEKEKGDSHRPFGSLHLVGKDQE